jgi:glycine/D-amino acid oxidase-like deaminating enzyme
MRDVVLRSTTLLLTAPPDGVEGAVMAVADQTEVLIVGSGPTGLALAVRLALQGTKFVLVDRLAAALSASRGGGACSDAGGAGTVGRFGGAGVLPGVRRKIAARMAELDVR